MNTTYFLNAVAGNLFRTKTTPALPTKYYLGLSTTTPDADGNGVTEPATTAAYARVELTSLGEPTAGVVSNTDVINFPESTGAWGTITYYVIYDSPAVGAGNLLMYGALNTPRNVEAASIMTVKKDYLNLSVANPA